MIIIVLAVLAIILVSGGIWGLVVAWYEELELLVADPILRWISNQEKGWVFVFIPLCLLTMSIRRLITYSPAWLSLYAVMHLGNVPEVKIYGILKFCIFLSALLKTASVMKQDYYAGNSIYTK